MQVPVKLTHATRIALPGHMRDHHYPLHALALQEYQRLVRAAAEARAAHARGGTAAMPTTTTATVSISSSDHARLLASVHERDALAAALTARSGAGLVAEGEAGASAVLVETLEAALSAARVQVSSNDKTVMMDGSSC